MALKVKLSNPLKPARIMIYGGVGVGKTTLGARAPKPVFISAEGGTDQVTDAEGNPVAEIDGIKDWTGIIQAVKDLITDAHEFKTLVIDSADWLEKMCHQKIIGTSGHSIVTVNKGYGAGYRAAEAMHVELRDLLTQLRDKRGMNIVVTAHSEVKDVKDPSMPHDYQQHKPKCHDYVNGVWKEWVDALLFARFETFTKDSDTAKARAFGTGKRIVYTVEQPSFQAKNRYTLPPEMEFTLNLWNDILAFRQKNPQKEVVEGSLEDVAKELNERWEKITDETLKQSVKDTVAKAGQDLDALKKILARVRELQKGQS